MVRDPVGEAREARIPGARAPARAAAQEVPAARDRAPAAWLVPAPRDPAPAAWEVPAARDQVLAARAEAKVARQDRAMADP